MLKPFLHDSVIAVLSFFLTDSSLITDFLSFFTSCSIQNSEEDWGISQYLYYYDNDTP